jgi:Zn-finger nucleic acid-binding protein
MKCPRCKTRDLKPTMIEENLPAMSCADCEGSLVSLLYYRHWAETQKPATSSEAGRESAASSALASTAATPTADSPTADNPTADNPNAENDESLEAADTRTAVLCPKCGRVMMKYKITGRVSNRLDVCRLCDESWLDRGEWELLETLQLSTQMPAIFTEEWQKRIRRQITEEVRRSSLARCIGERAVEQVDKFRDWLSRSKHKPEVMSYLYRGWS